MKITAFKTVSDIKTPFTTTAISVLEKFKNDDYGIKEAQSKEGFKDFKKTLPVACFGGVFSKRASSALLEGSGLLILDLDNLDHLKDKKVSLSSNKHVYSCFISPSGNGLKVLVRIPVVESDKEYKEYYNSFIENIDNVDTSGKDVSRACFFSYDPDIYINEDAEVWDKKKVEDVKFSKLNKEQLKNDYSTANRVLNIIRFATIGERHDKMLKASRLMGGYVSGKKISYEEAVRLLEQEAHAIAPDTPKHNRDTVLDGLEHGMKDPLTDYKELEKEESEQRLGKIYYTLKDREESIENLYSNGLQKGVSTGFNCLDDLMSVKLGCTTYVYGAPYSGKSQIWLEILVNLSVLHGWKHAIFSPETGNSDDIFIELMTVFIRKDFYPDYNNKMNEEQKEEAKKFVDEHFIVIDPNDGVFTVEDFFNYVDIVERVFNTKIHTTVADPFNEFRHDFSKDNNRQDMYIERVLGDFRRNAQMNERHNCLITHIQDQAVQMQDGVRYYPPATFREIAGGQAWSRKGQQMISVWRPPQGLKDENGVEYLNNEVCVIVQKSKPKGVGKNGTARMFYDSKLHSYYEFGASQYIYASRDRKEEVKNNKYELPKIYDTGYPPEWDL